MRAHVTKFKCDNCTAEAEHELPPAWFTITIDTEHARHACSVSCVTQVFVELLKHATEEKQKRAEIAANATKNRGKSGLVAAK